jgi:hypothetical protein
MIMEINFLLQLVLYSGILYYEPHFHLLNKFSTLVPFIIRAIATLNIAMSRLHISSGNVSFYVV